MSDVVHANSEHERHRHRAGRQQPEEVLSRQVRGERPAVRGSVGAFGTAAVAAERAHRSPGSDELQDALAPHVALQAQLNADDTVSAEVVGLGLHPGHGQFPGVVHRLSQDLQFLVLRPSSDLQADVIDRRSHHEPERLEPGLAEQHVLRDRQVGGENASRSGACGLGQPAGRGLRLPGGCIVGWLVAEKWHVTLLWSDSPGTCDSTRGLPVDSAPRATSIVEFMDIESDQAPLGGYPAAGRAVELRSAGESPALDHLLGEQVAYYRALGGDYLDQGLDLSGGSELTDGLEAFQPRGSVLELACGPGVWTGRLLRYAADVTAVDASAEMLAIAAARLGAGRARLIQADLFDWTPDRRYDVV